MDDRQKQQATPPGRRRPDGRPANPFLRRVRSLGEIAGPTDAEVSEALWGHKDGPLAARGQPRGEEGRRA